MRIIISGGTGLIGRALSAQMVEAGHEVVVLSRSPARVQGLPAGVRAVAWDGKTAAGWGALVDGSTALVNLAGESISGESPLKMRWTAARKERILASRVNAGRAMVEAVRLAAHQPAVLVQASAVGYYGAHREKTAPISEDAPPGHDFLAGVCLQWEAATREVEDLGVRRAITRLGVVLAPGGKFVGGGALPLQTLPFKMFLGGPIGSGRQGYAWVHLQDAAGALRFLCETPAAQGVYNLVAPQPQDNAGFGRTLAKVLQRPYWLPLPGFVFKLAFGEAATVLLDGQFVSSARLQAAGYRFRFPELEAALGDLV